MERRTLLKALGLAMFAREAIAAPPKTMKGVEELEKNWKSFLPAGASVPSPNEPVKLAKDEWKKKQPPQSFLVKREEGPQRAGTRPLNYQKRARRFPPAGCRL